MFSDQHHFINRLRILRSIDSFEVIGVASQENFIREPFEYLVRANPKDSKIIFEAILRRERPILPDTLTLVINPTTEGDAVSILIGCGVPVLDAEALGKLFAKEFFPGLRIGHHLHATTIRIWAEQKGHSVSLPAPEATPHKAPSL